MNEDAKENSMFTESRTRAIETAQTKGLAPLGLFTNHDWSDDPKHLVFTFSRYKFVSKMLRGKKNVLEIGCGDGFATRIVRQEVAKLTAIDCDSVLIDDCIQRSNDDWKVDFKVHDILDGPLDQTFDAAYLIDVIEHIDKRHEELLMYNVANSLVKDGELIIGTPSIFSQKYACPLSKAGHVNCMDDEQLRELMKKYFHHVFIFSMNDEVVHTGFYKMAHYYFALCCSKR